MIVVHLTGMRDHRNRIGFCHSSDLASLGDSADAIGVELDIVQRTRVQQVTEPIRGEFMFAASNRNSAVGL